MGGLLGFPLLPRTDLADDSMRGHCSFRLNDRRRLPKEQNDRQLSNILLHLHLFSHCDCRVLTKVRQDRSCLMKSPGQYTFFVVMLFQYGDSYFTNMQNHLASFSSHALSTQSISHPFSTLTSRFIPHHANKLYLTTDPYPIASRDDKSMPTCKVPRKVVLRKTLL